MNKDRLHFSIVPSIEKLQTLPLDAPVVMNTFDAVILQRMV